MTPLLDIRIFLEPLENVSTVSFEESVVIFEIQIINGVSDDPKPLKGVRFFGGTRPKPGKLTPNWKLNEIFSWAALIISGFIARALYT